MSTSVGTLLHILSDQTTEVSRWLQHGDTVYAERLGSFDSAATMAAAPAAPLDSEPPATPTVFTSAPEPDLPSASEIAKSVATVRNLRLVQLMHQCALRKAKSPGLLKVLQSAALSSARRVSDPEDRKALEEEGTGTPVGERVSELEAGAGDAGPDLPSVKSKSPEEVGNVGGDPGGDAGLEPAPTPALPVGTGSPITTGSSVSVKELVARHQSSKSALGIATPETRRRKDSITDVPPELAAPEPLLTPSGDSGKKPPSHRRLPRSGKMSVNVDEAGQPVISVDKPPDADADAFPEVGVVGL